MLCNVGCFSVSLFRRIHKALNRKGRLVIVDKFAPSRTSAPPSRLLSVFLASLVSPAKSVDYITAEMVQSQLHQAGFRRIMTISMQHIDNLPWNVDWTLIEAQK